MTEKNRRPITKICIDFDEYHSLLALKEKYIALEEKYKQLLEIGGMFNITIILIKYKK